MKHVIYAALMVCLLAPSLALADDSEREKKAEACGKIADEFTTWVMDTKKGMKEKDLQSLQDEISSTQKYNGVTNRVAARANALLDKDLTRAQINANLYGLCMSII